MLALADALVAVLVVITVHTIRYSLAGEPTGAEALRSLWAPILLYAVLWVSILYLVGEYRLRAYWTLRTEIAGIAKAAMWLALLSLSLLFLTVQTEVSRAFVLLLFPVQAIATVATRGTLRLILARLRRRGRNIRHLLVIGTGPEATGFARQVEAHTTFGIRVMGFLGDEPEQDGDDEPDQQRSDDPDAERGPWPYLGPVRDVVRILHEHVVDEVGICLPREQWSIVERLVRLAQAEGKVVRIPLDAPTSGPGLQFVEDLDGTPVVSIVQAPDRVLALGVKRTIDVVVAALTLVLLSPVLVGVALYILARGGLPILFRQTRVGMHGRHFVMLKFRTMVKDAEERFSEVADSNETRGPAFKMEEDPRVLPWGRRLRRFSLDELPQLLNVLKGDMSLVGPRPAPPREVSEYEVWHRRRLSMKPGMTGLWQVSSRLDQDFDQRAKLDLDYIDRWSIWLDLRIVARTVPTLLQPGGR